MDTESYGLFSLAWTIINYMAVLDLGIGTAVTRYIAQELSLDHRERIQSVFWTAFTMLLILGVVFALLLAMFTPYLVDNAMHIPSHLRTQAKTMFWLLAISIPFIFMNNSMRGGLEAAQRFDIVNLVRTPYNAAIYLLPLMGYFIGWRIDIITGSLLVAIILAFFAYTIGMLSEYPWIYKAISLRLDEAGKITRFSGWVAASNGFSAIFVYVERLLITTTLSLVSLAYFTAPYDALTRIWIIPMSITAVLLPVFSENRTPITSLQQDEKMVSFSMKFLFVIIGPLAAFIVIFSREILSLWLGAEYGLNSSTIAIYLAVGIFFNSFGRIPATLLYGKERPDLPVKLYIVELPLYLLVGYLLILRWGVAGLAFAWLLRTAADTILLFFFTNKLGLIRFNKIITKSTQKYVYSLIGLTATFLLIHQLLGFVSIYISLFMISITALLFGLFVWFILLETYEKTRILSVFQKLIPIKSP